MTGRALELRLQSDYDMLQVVEGEVDVLGFLEDPTISTSLSHSLRASQVHQVQLRPDRVGNK